MAPDYYRRKHIRVVLSIGASGSMNTHTHHARICSASTHYLGAPLTPSESLITEKKKKKKKKYSNLCVSVIRSRVPTGNYCICSPFSPCGFDMMDVWARRICRENKRSSKTCGGVASQVPRLSAYCDHDTCLGTVSPPTFCASATARESKTHRPGIDGLQHCNTASCIIGVPVADIRGAQSFAQV